MLNTSSIITRNIVPILCIFFTGCFINDSAKCEGTAAQAATSADPSTMVDGGELVYKRCYYTSGGVTREEVVGALTPEVEARLMSPSEFSSVDEPWLYTDSFWTDGGQNGDTQTCYQVLRQPNPGYDPCAEDAPDMPPDTPADMYNPFPGIDPSTMTKSERADFCLSINNIDDCSYVQLNIDNECHYPNTIVKICIKNSQCIYEITPGYCIHGGITYSTASSDPYVNYKIEDGVVVDAVRLPESTNFTGWEWCDGPKEGAPEVCKCAPNNVDRVEGTCP